MAEETSRHDLFNASLNHRQFRPQFKDKLVELPPIEKFGLENLINDQLKQESQQVVDSLVNVAANYQNDLRMEIRRKLSTEQKIQYKNIEIAKLASSINKFIHKTRKNLKKSVQDNGFESLNSDIDELLKLSLSSSDKCKSITEKLARIDQLVNDSNHTLQNPISLNRQKYPNLHKLFHPQENIVDHSTNNNHPSFTRSSHGSANLDTPLGFENPTDKESTTSDSLANDNENIEEINHGTTNVGSKVKLENVSIGKIDVNDISNYNTNRVNDETTNESYEIKTLKQNNEIEKPFQTVKKNDFSISASIIPNLHQSSTNDSKLSTDSDKYKDPKKDEQIQTLPSNDLKPNDSNLESQEIPMTAEEFEKYMSESISKYREARERRYSKLNPFNDKVKISNQFSTNNPINLLYSLLLSNPKYIELSPINEINPFSNMLSIKSSATIKLSLQTSHHKKLRINGAPITSASYINSNTKLLCACSGETQKNDHLKAESLAKKSLAETLNHLALASDDELWNSSGITTETEDDDEFITPKISSSHSSDSDSLDNVNSESIQNINGVYSALKSGKKIQALKKDRRSRLKKKRHKLAMECKDSSPSPKHKPSHHILKPKRSILKLKSSLGRKPTKSAEINVQEVSALADVNSTFDRSSRSSITDYTVCGTIVVNPIDDSDYVIEDTEVEPWYGDMDNDNDNDNYGDGDSDSDGDNDHSGAEVPSMRSIAKLKDLL